MKFEIGKAITLREGNDVAFIATGETVIHALLAAGQLAERGVTRERVKSRLDDPATWAEISLSLKSTRSFAAFLRSAVQ